LSIRIHELRASVYQLCESPWFVPIVLLLLAIGTGAGTAGCGRGGSVTTTGTGGSGNPPPPAITVSVSPTSASVLLGNTQQFSATVTGTANTAVSWSVNNVAGGNSTVGTITSAGIYTAPADLPSPASVTISATSQATSSTTASSTASITSDIQVSVQASATSAVTGGAIQLTATITSAGHPDQSVTWSVNGVAGGNATIGTITSTGTGAATFTAPSALPSPAVVTIQAVSIADPSKSSSITETIVQPAVTLTGIVSIAPISGATVTAFDLNNDGNEGTTLASSTTDANGNYSLPLAVAPANPILLVATGGSYTDEVTGDSVTLSGSEQLTAVVPVGVTQAAITPLTHMAAARARTLGPPYVSLAAAASSPLSGIDQQYQIVDILGTPPAAANNATAIGSTTLTQRNYSLVLAGLMQEANTLGVKAIDLAGALATDASDGTLDGTNGGAAITVPATGGGTVTLAATAGTSDLQSAINTFTASTSNKTNITTVDILTTSVNIAVNGTQSYYVTNPVLGACVTGTNCEYSFGSSESGPQSCTFTNLPSAFQQLDGNGCVIAGLGPALPPDTPMEILPGPITAVMQDTNTPPNKTTINFYITVVEQPPDIVGADITCAAGSPCEGQIAQASGGTPPYYFLTGNGFPPFGTSVDSCSTGSDDACISGTPENPGNSTFDVCAVDLFGDETNPCASVTVTVTGIYDLTATIAGTGSGSISQSSSATGTSCGDECTAYPDGAVVTVTAVAATGSTFAGWSGACSGPGSCTVTMTQNQSVTANFSPQSFDLTVATAGSGSGTVSQSASVAGTSCGAGCTAYPDNTVVTLTANAASGSTFAGWSGACSGTSTCTVTMNQSQTVTATFNTNGGSSGTETWTVTLTGTITQSSDGWDDCYALGAYTGPTGVWSFSYQVSLTFSGSLVAALQAENGVIGGTGTVSGSQTVSTQDQPNSDNCQLEPSSLSNVAVTASATGPTSSNPVQIMLMGPQEGNSAATSTDPMECEDDNASGNQCVYFYAPLQPSSITATQITGGYTSEGGFQGTFTLTKQ
jgi:uncharacterized repeat protein (TIGR02543 family)